VPPTQSSRNPLLFAGEAENPDKIDRRIDPSLNGSLKLPGNNVTTLAESVLRFNSMSRRYVRGISVRQSPNSLA
jgi:hypothetical protein